MNYPFDGAKALVEYAYYSSVEVLSTTFSHAQDMEEGVEYSIESDLMLESDITEPDVLTLSIKRVDASGIHFLVYEEVLDVISGVVEEPTIPTVTLDEDETIYACIYTRDPAVLSQITSNEILFQSSGNDDIVYGLSVWYYGPELIGTRVHEGNDYRGWGKFFYTPGYNSMGEPSIILREDLVIPEDEDGYNDPDADIEDVRYWRVNLVCMDDELVWSMGDPSSKMIGIEISSSRLGEDNVEPDQIPLSGGGIRVAAIKKNRINSGSSSSSSGFTIPIGAVDVGYSASVNSESRSLLDFMDVNGDGFPDFVEDDKVLYSNSIGDYDDTFTEFSDGQVNRNAKQDFKGITGGGSFGFGKQTHTVFTPKILVLPVIGILAVIVEASQETSHNGNVGLSVELSQNFDDENVALIDINGDGLPDRLDKQSGMVRLNLGYSFSEAFGMDYQFDPELGEEVIGRSRTDVVGGGGSLGYSLKNGSWGAGFGGTISKTISTHSLRDINSDGLLDMVIYNKASGEVSYLLNHNGSFVSYGEYSLIDGKVHSATSFGASASTSLTLRFPVFPLIDLAINPSLSGSLGMSRTETQYADIDGDGFVDYLTTNPPDNIRTDSYDGDRFVQVHRAQIGKSNKLRSITLPFGGEIELEYGLTAATYDHPGGKWVVSAVTVNDNTEGDGVNSSRQEFTYEEGFYDRCERRFLGYGRVTIDQMTSGEEMSGLYRKSINEYHTDFYRSGIAKSAELWNSNDERFTRIEMETYSGELSMDASINSYTFSGAELIEDAGVIHAPQPFSSIFTSVDRTTTFWFEGGTVPYLASQDQSIFDSYGNVTSYRFTNSGQDLSFGERYSTTITYAQDLSLNVLGIAESSTVSNGPNEVNANAIVRQVSSEVETSFARLESVTVMGSPNSTTEYSYNETYGVLTGSILPFDGNETGNRIEYTYRYDGDLGGGEGDHLFVSSITESIASGNNPYTYTTEMRGYDYRWGTFGEQVDINGNVMAYRYDSRGRLIQVTGPKEYDPTDMDKFTVRYSYPTTIAGTIEDIYTTTTRFDPLIEDNDIVSWAFVDGLGREIQTITESMIETDPDAGTVESVLIRSGLRKYDGLGRLHEKYYPTIANYNVNGFEEFDLTPDEGKHPSNPIFSNVITSQTFVIKNRDVTNTNRIRMEGDTGRPARLRPHQARILPAKRYQTSELLLLAAQSTPRAKNRPASIPTYTHCRVA